MQHQDGERPSSFAGGMASNIPSCPPSPSPSPPLPPLSPSPTRPSSPISPRPPLSPGLLSSQGIHASPRSLSPPNSPNLSVFRQSNNRPLSPAPLSPPPPPLSPPPAAAAAVTTPRPSFLTSASAQSKRTSVQSLSRMPPIREDFNSIFSDVCNAEHRRSRSSFYYQYGEDYITTYDRVGLKSSPSPRPTSRAGSTLSAKSLRRSASVRSEKSSHSRRSSEYSTPSSEYSTPSSVRSASADPLGSQNRLSGYNIQAGYVDRGRKMSRDDHRDLERGPVSEPESEVEKVALEMQAQRPSYWRRWRRFFIILMAALGLAGVAVGIIFGTRSS